MFCNQCEQTKNSVSCTKVGVCGKQESTANIQDIIVMALRSLSLVAIRARKNGVINDKYDHLAVQGLFSTLTNVNFDDEALIALFTRIIDTKLALAKEAKLTLNDGIESFGVNKSVTEMIAGHQITAVDKLNEDQDINSIMHTLLYALKGIAAYTDHAAILGVSDQEHYSNFHRGMVAGYDGVERDLAKWIDELMFSGMTNLKAMELLDKANTDTFGHPVPTEVPLGPVAGKAILVTGHDLKDLYVLLKATEGKGINIYTHGEMLPAHGYPGLKKFKHLVGHFGTAWQNQAKEFPDFPGAILFTTNCIQKPAASYANNVFTTGLVGWPGITHVMNGQFDKVIEHALGMAGFSNADEESGNKTKVITGFARQSVLGVADKVIDAVKSGDIQHFFLVGGCDGAKPGRNYYTEFVEKAPKDTIILTLACGKFRFFDKDLGNIGGIPRLLDVGQCNDAYSAIQIALALADAFNCGVNDLPLSIVLSWYEQKAVAILITLLALGIKGMRLGPTLPAFLSPNVLNLLVDKFDIAPIGDPDEDLKVLLK